MGTTESHPFSTTALPTDAATLHTTAEKSQAANDSSPKVVVVIKNGLSPSSHLEAGSMASDTASLVSSISDSDLPPTFAVKQWDGKKLYSDFIRDGLKFLNRDTSNVVMLFESPSTSTSKTSFFNSQVFKFHDWPPTAAASKGVLGPCRYSLMNGSSFPSFLKAGAPPAGLMEHWAEAVPGHIAPSFVPEIPEDAAVYAYLPVETITKHVNDPHMHYFLCGKNAIPLMTDKTPRLLPNTTQHRPCIAKTTHSMGSKGIFVIRNDEDDAVFQKFLQDSGNPSFVVTEFVEIERNVACHFFMHPNGDITWFGSNENLRDAAGNWSSDSYLIQADQAKLREMQLPFVRDVARYCHSVGFWGLCGVDVLFDKEGKGYLVDVNPRVTGSNPSLMVGRIMKETYGYEVGLFRRSGGIRFHGNIQELFEQVREYNVSHEGDSRVVIFSCNPCSDGQTSINVGVYGHSIDVCRNTLNQFAKPRKLKV